VEAVDFIKASCTALEPEGVLYLSTMLGRSEDSGLERCSSGDQVYVTYHSEEQIVGLVQGCGLGIVRHKQISSPSTASKATTDLILIASKGSAYLQ
jgi:hypothetical protein